MIREYLYLFAEIQLETEKIVNNEKASDNGKDECYHLLSRK